MKQYKYTAVNINKEKFVGTFLAKDEKDLATQLAKQNLYLVSASIYSGKTPSAFFTTGTGTISTAELTAFCRQISIMLASGMPIIETLESLKEQPYTKFFKNILQIIYDDVKSGMALSEALNKHGKVFPEFFRSMIYVGELSGKLDEVFLSLADYYEKDAATKRKVKSAFSYPIMLGLMTVGIVILMLAFVIPTFRDALDSLDVSMNGLTSTIYGISDFLTQSWLYLLAGVIVIVGGIFIASRTERGAYFFDKLLISIPFTRKIQLDLVSSRFARGFSLMMSSGMDIVDALNAIEVVITNREIKRRFHKASEEVQHGMKLADAFRKHNIFPPLLLQMINVGEKTASLDTILNRSKDYFDEQVDIALTNLTSKIQPIMLIIMGVLVGTMFIAVYSPMISIMENLI